MNRQEIMLDNNEKCSLFDIDMILEQCKTQLIIKRIFDIILSSVGLVCLTGSVLFKQIRVGKNGKEFKILKFRTMVVDAENKGIQLTIGKDNRVTKVGYLLRKTKLDELPQLINVLNGDMSFVGPRPEVPKYVALYNGNQRNILKVRPGITDLASIKYRNENILLAKTVEPEKTYIEEIIPAKVALNNQYLQNISVVNDLKIIIKTILLLFMRSK